MQREWITFNFVLTGFLLIWILISGCATKLSFSEDPGDVVLRQYSVPIEFSIAAGSHGNFQ